MPKQSHWTEESPEAFAHSVAFGFIAQIEKRLSSLNISQTELARRLAVSEGAVSKVLNNRQNLTLNTISKYARALETKIAVVAYDDGDPSNKRGPVMPEIFTACWDRAGRPHDEWSLESTLVRTTRSRAHRLFRHFPKLGLRPVRRRLVSHRNSRSTGWSG